MTHTDLVVRNTNAANGALVLSLRMYGRDNGNRLAIVEALEQALMRVPSRIQADIWLVDEDRSLSAGARVALSPEALAYTLAEWQCCAAVLTAIGAQALTIYGEDLIDRELRARAFACAADRRPIPTPDSGFAEADHVEQLPLASAPSWWTLA